MENLLTGQGPGLPSASDLIGVFPVDTFAELVSPDGQVVNPSVATVRGQTPTRARPQLPSSLPGTAPDRPVTFTAPGTGGIDQYDVLAVTMDSPAAAGYTMVVAVPLGDVESTLDHLLALEATIGAAVLLGMAVLAWWIIRLGLAPLERMGATAQAIAAGDLGRRVEPASSRTEIGRLGLALNGMLSQIEAAFAERLASENRLRRFLADASHELRTPLTSIRGYAEFLRRRPAPAPRDASLARRRIEEEAVRMSGLVDDLLLLARLDQGRPLERAPVDLRTIAEDALADARASAPRRTINLEAAGGPVVIGDQMRLRQVVANLLRNAIVHTPAATPIELRLAAGGGRAVLSVADHGPGLSDEEARHIFEPFYRADPARARDRGGAGLGLSIVEAVVGAHQGEVRVTPTAGGGTTFTVDLPLAPGSGASAAALPAETEPDTSRVGPEAHGEASAG
ncbi:MAG: sensor histidine kinase, partial [Candidatus Dormibacterales bacterium]